MLWTFVRWRFGANSLEFSRNRLKLSADKMYRACELKDQTYKKTRTLHFPDLGALWVRGPRRGFSEISKTSCTQQSLQARSSAICWVNLYRAHGCGGFGSQTAADPPSIPRKTPEKQTVGSVPASHNMLTQALSSSLNAGTAKRGCLGRVPGPRKRFWVTSGNFSPETAASIYTF